MREVTLTRMLDGLRRWEKRNAEMLAGEEADFPSCGDCRFVQSIMDDNHVDGWRLMCRRRAPLPDGNGNGAWPVVTFADWCGEYDEDDR